MFFVLVMYYKSVCQCSFDKSLIPVYLDRQRINQKPLFGTIKRFLALLFTAKRDNSLAPVSVIMTTNVIIYLTKYVHTNSFQTSTNDLILKN